MSQPMGQIRFRSNLKNQNYLKIANLNTFDDFLPEMS